MSMTLKQIDASIKSIAKRGKALRDDSHKTLVGIIDHYIEHGDKTRLKVLVDTIKSALGGSLAQAANQWVSNYVPSLKWNDTDKDFEHLKNVKKEVLDVEYRSTDGSFTFSGNARGLPFFKLERPVNVAPFDLKARVLMLIKQAENTREKQIKEGEKITVSLTAINALKALDFDHLLDVPKEVAEIVPAEQVSESVKATAAATPKAEEAKATAQAATPKTPRKAAAQAAA